MPRSPEPATLLSCRDLLVGYGGHPILPPINVRARAGEFWAIVGVNGSGKTTFLRTALGLLGRIDGELVWAENAVVSYVAQHHDVDASLPGRVRDFVGSGRDRGWSFLSWRHADSDAVQRALEDARCEDLEEEQFASLSEGQKGRARIARALASGPNVLVLDEPTSAVDSVTERAVFDTLDTLRRTRGVTIFVVSHRTRVFAGRATHALYVDRAEGAAVAGAFDEVVQAPAFLSRHGPIATPVSEGLGGTEGSGG